MSRTSFERHMYILFAFYVQGVLSEKKNKTPFLYLREVTRKYLEHKLIIKFGGQSVKQNTVK